jgi:hypothetical protein
MVEGLWVGRKALPNSPRATKARAKLLLRIATPAFVNFVSFWWEIFQMVGKEAKDGGEGLTEILSFGASGVT